MSLAYTFRESLSGFRRTKLSSTISIITISISLLLLGTFAVVSVHASRFIDSIRSKVELEVFLQEPITAEQTSDLGRTVANLEGVEQAIYISKEEAAQIFQQEFGEEIGSVLDFNPLPPSFRVTLLPAYRTAVHARELNDRLLGLPGVESVVYRRALLELIDERSATATRLALGFGTLISAFAVLLVSNTIRLAIYAKRTLIRTMELVGATRSFIRFPFLLEGLVQGIVGGFVASLLFYGVLEYGIAFVAPELGDLAGMGGAFYASVVAGGGLLGLLGSAISVIRFIRPAGER